MSSMLRVSIAFALAFFLTAVSLFSADSPKPPSVFDLPMMTAAEKAVGVLLARGDYARAEELLERTLKTTPQDFTARYNLACTLARQGKTDAA